MPQSPSRLLFDDKVHTLKLQEYREVFQECDLLLWEPTSIYGRFIAAGTQGQVSHVSAVVKVDGHLFSAALEEKAGRGGLTPLAGEIARWPGKISVFRNTCISDTERHEIRKHLFNNLSASYDWGSIRVIALGQLILVRILIWLLPGVRAWYRGLVDSAEKRSSQTTVAICSQYIHRSFSQGCNRPVFIKKHSPVVTPNDIGLSAETQYLGTLVP